MSDIAPELLQKLQNVFRKKVEEDPALNNIRKKMAEKSAGSEDAECFSVRIGELLGETFGEVLQPGTLPNDIMYYNIASRIVPPLMKEEFNYVSNASVDIIRIQNEQHGGSLARTIVNRTKINPNRIDGMVNLACSKPFPAVKRTFLEAMVNFAQNVNAQTVHQNAEDNYRMGFSPKLHRKSSGNCCKWCSEKAGDYDYRPKMDRDVFRRHANCRCQILYDPDGTGKRLQDSHTKKWGTEKELRKQNQERLKKQEEEREKQLKGKKLEKKVGAVPENSRKKKKSKGTEKGLDSQTINQLKKSIRSLNKQIEKHKEKIAHPELIYPNWDKYNEIEKEGYKKHWKKEISTFEIQIERREREIDRRQSDGTDH